MGPVKQGVIVSPDKGTEKPRGLYRDPGKAASGVGTKSARPLGLEMQPCKLVWKTSLGRLPLRTELWGYPPGMPRKTFQGCYGCGSGRPWFSGH